MKYSEVEMFPNKWLNTLTHNDIMNNAFPLIVDRDKSDVERVKLLSGKGWISLTDDEKKEWNGVMKGAYNANDLYRVETASGWLSELLQKLPDELKQYAANRDVGWDSLYDAPYTPDDMVVTTKTDWSVQSIPFVADMTRYLNNVKTLKSAFEYDTPELPDTMSKLGYVAANAIEQALIGLYLAITQFYAQTTSYINRVPLGQFYSGEIFCGEV